MRGRSLTDGEPSAGRNGPINRSISSRHLRILKLRSIHQQLPTKSDELQDLWARLLAASMKPKKQGFSSGIFAEALEDRSDSDAKVMAHFSQTGSRSHFDRAKWRKSSAFRMTSLRIPRNLTNIGSAADDNTLSMVATVWPRIGTDGIQTFHKARFHSGSTVGGGGFNQFSENRPRRAAASRPARIRPSTALWPRLDGGHVRTLRRPHTPVGAGSTRTGTIESKRKHPRDPCRPAGPHNPPLPRQRGIREPTPRYQAARLWVGAVQPSNYRKRLHPRLVSLRLSPEKKRSVWPAPPPGHHAKATKTAYLSASRFWGMAARIAIWAIHRIDPS